MTENTQRDEVKGKQRKMEKVLRSDKMITLVTMLEEALKDPQGK